jgi:trans-2-enoyl-CoA reductase
LFGDYKSLQTDYEKKEAKEWIDLNNENFKQVCEYAGFNPQFVFNLLRKGNYVR